MRWGLLLKLRGKKDNKEMPGKEHEAQITCHYLRALKPFFPGTGQVGRLRRLSWPYKIILTLF